MSYKYSRAEIESAARARGIPEDEIKRVMDNVNKVAAKGLLKIDKSGDMSITAAGKKQLAANKAAGLTFPVVNKT